jgi:hypothetical protein
MSNQPHNFLDMAYQFLADIDQMDRETSYSVKEPDWFISMMRIREVIQQEIDKYYGV